MNVDAALWRAIVNCDPTFDGQYVYAVTTTGIFCRPSCRSRTPKPENVRIFHSPDEALAAGFRPCKRCRPEENAFGPEAALVEQAKAIIEQRYPEPLTLGTLAKQLSVSPCHLHRMFKRWTGITPAKYILKQRLQAAEAALRTDSPSSITEVALAVGFRSASHFTAVFRKATGYTPTEYRVLNRSRRTVPKEAVR
jgi:AraC family transcriptional regulator of adaptative response / methylphosphotriester-DNA alkyltransferase methyltransferase